MAEHKFEETQFNTLVAAILAVSKKPLEETLKQFRERAEQFEQAEQTQPVVAGLEQFNALVDLESGATNAIRNARLKERMALLLQWEEHSLIDELDFLVTQRLASEGFIRDSQWFNATNPLTSKKSSVT